MQIQLNKGLFSTIDDYKFREVAEHNWYAEPRSDGDGYYVRSRIDGKLTYLHRFVINATKGAKIDHRDGNGLNNQLANLRTATTSQNGANRKKLSSNNTSGYFGVYWIRAKRKWRAEVTVNCNRYHLGYFKTATDAAIARDKAAKFHFGEFATLNFPTLNFAM